MLNSKYICFKDKENNQYIIENFQTNIIVNDGKVLVVRHTILQSIDKIQNILVPNEVSSKENKLGIGTIINSSVNLYKEDDIIIFNTWNICLEFTCQGQTYYIVKNEDIHGKCIATKK